MVKLRINEYQFEYQYDSHGVYFKFVAMSISVTINYNNKYYY